MKKDIGKRTIGNFNYQNRAKPAVQYKHGRGKSMAENNSDYKNVFYRSDTGNKSNLGKL